MKQKIELMGYNLQGYWRDVGNPQSYREVYEDILSGEVKFKIPGKKKKYPDGVLYSLGKNEIADSVEVIGSVVLGNNVTIQKNVKLTNTVIGDNVTIGASSKIKNSVFWEDIKVAKHVLMDGCVICNPQ